MGNLTYQENITISVHSPAHRLFNFHTDYHPDNHLSLLDYPSFIKTNQCQGIEYSIRSSYNDRQYEITHRQEDRNTYLIFNRMNEKVEPIWKVIAPNETLPLFEGCVVKLGQTVFQIKKICRNFHDIQGWQENLMTLSDGDPRQSLNNQMLNSRNLMQKLVNSRRLQNSRLLNFSLNDKSFTKNDSKASFGFDSDTQFCRYCYGRDNTSGNPLLNLCKCSGSVKYSHYYCLKNWISSRSVTRASDCYEYFEYDLSCEVCKQKIEKKTTHKGKKYIIYSESLIHPPFMILSYKNESSPKVKEYIINFDYNSEIKIGKGPHCNLQLPQKTISHQHCELLFENGEILLRSLNPAFGTFIQIDDEWSFSPLENQLEVMIGNHLVRIKDQSTSCLGTQPLKLKIMNQEDI